MNINSRAKIILGVWVNHVVIGILLYIRYTPVSFQKMFVILSAKLDILSQIISIPNTLFQTNLNIFKIVEFGLQINILGFKHSYI